jgi:hypothetical protein
MFDYNQQQIIPQIREEMLVDYRIVLENQRLIKRKYSTFREYS